MKIRNNILILAFVFLLCSCNSHTTDEASAINKPESDSLAVTSTDKKSERLFPEIKVVSRFDTLIADIQITIIKTDLNSYITFDYEENGVLHTDKYRDAEISLSVKQKSQILLDTVFRKEQFIKYADINFMNVAIFHNYWFNKLYKNRIELFGVINKPETDYSLAFNHYFDITNKKLTFVEHIDDKE